MFNVVKDIVVQKTGKSLNRNDFEDVYNPYMISRWISMYSDLNVEKLNSSVNILYKSLDNRQQFKLLSVYIPSCPMRGKYIKVKEKKKVNKSKKDEINISQSFEESSTKIEESLALVLGDKYK